MESSIAEFLLWLYACELQPTATGHDSSSLMAIVNPSSLAKCHVATARCGGFQDCARAAVALAACAIW